MLLISSSETKGWRGQTGEEAQSDKALEITRDGVELLEPPRRLPAAIKVRRVVLKYAFRGQYSTRGYDSPMMSGCFGGYRNAGKEVDVNLELWGWRNLG